jgi:hypothetical protein
MGWGWAAWVVFVEIVESVVGFVEDTFFDEVWWSEVGGEEAGDFIDFEFYFSDLAEENWFGGVEWWRWAMARMG